MSICLRCKHWLPRETPLWAQRLGMAICGLKLTKATTLTHWATCKQFAAAPDGVACSRVEWLARRGVVVREAMAPPPCQGTTTAPANTGHSGREKTLVHGLVNG